MEPERDPAPVADDGDARLIDADAAARIAVLHSGDDGWILVRPNRSLTRTDLLVATADCHRRDRPLRWTARKGCD